MNSSSAVHVAGPVDGCGGIADSEVGRFFATQRQAILPAAKALASGSGFMCRHRLPATNSTMASAAAEPSDEVGSVRATAEVLAFSGFIKST
ncbi:MAG: hypothetical protein ACOYOF_04870 [Verrucomicrobiaceae bacterium]